MTNPVTAARTSGPLLRVNVPIVDLRDRLDTAVELGRRLGVLTARRDPASGSISLIVLLTNPALHTAELWESVLPSGARAFPSMTAELPLAHWFERAIYDGFGIMPEGHPHFKGLLLHETWPAGFHPLRELNPPLPDDQSPRRAYPFIEVAGEGVYEIPVGPIHAGIIEPGHFRFSCFGEIIHNLEIRLGYLHRGVEERLTRIPWRRARFLAEAASSDTTVGNALAHSLAIEQMLGVAPPPVAVTLRAAALEIERVASHVGDLGGICSDIGFAGGASVFGRLRGQALGMGERLTGARFQGAYVLPGGVAHVPDAGAAAGLLGEVESLDAALAQAVPLLLDNLGALGRMEGIGRVRPWLATDFGLVGPAGRASGVSCDVRATMLQEPYAALGWTPAEEHDGDVLARVRVRATEARASLALLRTIFVSPLEGEECRCSLPDALPSNGVGAGIVEAWRGELIHLVFTDADGAISRYAIKDPSFNNWTGLVIAARGELVSDFPLCNKSFGLSYSGNDL